MLDPKNFFWAIKIAILGSPAGTAEKLLSFVPVTMVLMSIYFVGMQERKTYIPDNITRA